MRDVLIRPHDDHASGLPINAAHRKDVVAAFDVGAKHLLIVVEAVTSLFGQKQRRHRLDGELPMSLLEHRADIDDRVDILALARIFSDGRVPALREKIAQPPDGGARGRRIIRSRKSENPKPPIRSGDVAEVDRLGIRDTDDRRGMKALPDDKSFGEMLVDRLGRSGSTDCNATRFRRYSARA